MAHRRVTGAPLCRRSKTGVRITPTRITSFRVPTYRHGLSLRSCLQASLSLKQALPVALARRLSLDRESLSARYGLGQRALSINEIELASPSLECCASVWHNACNIQWRMQVKRKMDDQRRDIGH